MNEATTNYVRQHADDDVRKLALQGTKDAEVDLTMALQQIAGRQTARRKLPSWAAVDGIVYPPHLNMEQCSSEQTARYKAKIAGKGESMVDLTGGFGIDFYWLSQGFQCRYYIEQNEELCAISSENFRTLGLECTVCCCDAVSYLSTMPHVDLIYMDPARRNEHGGRTYSIEDCTPNVMELLPLLMEKANRVMLKLSPMLDWRKAVADLKCVCEVHIVSVDNECKELLIEVRKSEGEKVRIICVNLHSDGSEELFGFENPSPSHPLTSSPPHLLTSSPSHLLTSSPPHFLYEPNASIMKAGCFKELAERFSVQQISVNSHIFLSSVEIDDFPGRRFQILSISSINKQELRIALKETERANISVRNFPLSADQLRKKLKLKDGGDTYIFATTTSDGAHRLFICRKIG